MSLKEKLLQDMKEAMKEKDTIRKDTVQIIRAGILQIEKDSKIANLDDSEIIDVITKELKKRYDVLPDYEKSGRLDSITDINRQIGILKSYLPEQLSEKEVTDIVLKVIAECGASSMKDMGKVMAVLSKDIKGKADNKLVSEIVKSNLK